MTDGGEHRRSVIRDEKVGVRAASVRKRGKNAINAKTETQKDRVEKRRIRREETRRNEFCERQK